MIKRVFGNLYLLTFLNGFLLASLFYFKMEANYEKELFEAIHVNISSRIKPNESQDSLVVKVMHTCHRLMLNNGSAFQGNGLFEGFKADIIEPTSMDLMTARGACGSYSIVLARILQGYNLDVRIAQMKSRGTFAAHNIVEVKTNKGWAVLDPLFDVYFITPFHRLASFADVRNNWDYYKTQLPLGYDMNYRYEDVRYSNWSKIPIILPAVKKILDLVLGRSAADAISVRTYFLRKYNICFNVFLGIFLFVMSFTIFRLIKAKVFPQKNIPVTFSNVYKHVRRRFYSKEFTEHGQA